MASSTSGPFVAELISRLPDVELRLKQYPKLEEMYHLCWNSDLQSQANDKMEKWRNEGQPAPRLYALLAVSRGDRCVVFNSGNPCPHRIPHGQADLHRCLFCKGTHGGLVASALNPSALSPKSCLHWKTAVSRPLFHLYSKMGGMDRLGLSCPQFENILFPHRSFSGFLAIKNMVLVSQTIKLGILAIIAETKKKGMLNSQLGVALLNRFACLTDYSKTDRQDFVKAAIGQLVASGKLFEKNPKTGHYSLHLRSGDNDDDDDEDDSGDDDSDVDSDVGDGDGDDDDAADEREEGADPAARINQVQQLETEDGVFSRAHSAFEALSATPQTVAPQPPSLPVFKSESTERGELLPYLSGDAIKSLEAQYAAYHARLYEKKKQSSVPASPSASSSPADASGSPAIFQHNLQTWPPKPYMNCSLLCFCSCQHCKSIFTSSSSNVPDCLIRHTVLPGIYYREANGDKPSQEAVVKIFTPSLKHLDDKTRIAEREAFINELTTYQSFFPEQLLASFPASVSRNEGGSLSVDDQANAADRTGGLQFKLDNVPSFFVATVLQRTDLRELLVQKQQQHTATSAVATVVASPAAVASSTTTIGAPVRAGERFSELLNLVRSVLVCVEAAHNASGSDAANSDHLLHGDIKPENFVQLRDKSISLIDFEFSSMKRLDSEMLKKRRAGPTTNQTPSKGGYTPFWCSIAKFSRGNAIKTHFCDDIFSLALVLYEVLHGDYQSRPEEMETVPQFWIDRIAEDDAAQAEQQQNTAAAPPQLHDESELDESPYERLERLYTILMNRLAADAMERTKKLEMPKVPAKCNKFLANTIDSMFAFYKCHHTLGPRGDRGPRAIFPFDQQLLLLDPSDMATVIDVLFDQVLYQLKWVEQAQLRPPLMVGLHALATILDRDQEFARPYFAGLMKKNSSADRDPRRVGLLDVINQTRAEHNKPLLIDEHENVEAMNAKYLLDRNKNPEKLCDTYSLLNALRQVRNLLAHSGRLWKSDVILLFLEFCPEIVSSLQEALAKLEKTTDFTFRFDREVNQLFLYEKNNS